MSTSDIHRPRGRPPLRWMDIVKKDLGQSKISLTEAIPVAEDKNKWLDIIDRCVKLTYLVRSVAIVAYLQVRYRHISSHQSELKLTLGTGGYPLYMWDHQ